MANEPLVIEGDLLLECQEGGYAADAVMIDGEDVAEVIRAAWECEDVRGFPRGLGRSMTSSGHAAFGRVRLTVERLP